MPILTNLTASKVICGHISPINQPTALALAETNDFILVHAQSLPQKDEPWCNGEINL
uniref:Uncharacterized protein n=1 Tax=Rhizophora mucronata TaxID=61149 RepID=A0A2P2QGW3_RHIMU